jgi:hypothetical protein
MPMFAFHGSTPDRRAVSAGRVRCPIRAAELDVDACIECLGSDRFTGRAAKASCVAVRALPVKSRRCRCGSRERRPVMIPALLGFKAWLANAGSRSATQSRTVNSWPA